SKGLLFALIVRFFGYRNVIPLAVGLGLFQVGEFTFVLARVGVASGSIDNELYSLILTVAIVTMLLTPLISCQTSRIYGLLQRRKGGEERLETSAMPDEGLKGHVIIAGGGRIGGQIAKILRAVERSCVLIEQDHRRFEDAKAHGYAAIYGDAGQEVVLEAAGISKAALLIITVPNIVEARHIVHVAQSHAPDIAIVARAAERAYLSEFHELGVDTVVLPEVEAGLEITRQALAFFQVPTSETKRHIRRERDELYGEMFTGFGQHSHAAEIRAAETELDLQWFSLASVSPIVGKSIAEAHIRQEAGVNIVGVAREGKFQATPPSTLVFETKDLVAAIGNEACLRQFRKKFVDNPEVAATDSRILQPGEFQALA
ncbi:MAG: NAD-binding protein, partial [Planctomycetes bacterium]|nr:NAD-binding protein [Planctomycetota bacterium]